MREMKRKGRKREEKQMKIGLAHNLNFISVCQCNFICAFNIKFKLYPASTMIEQAVTKEEASN